MTGIELGQAYSWRGARERGATRAQIAQDGVRVARGAYLSASSERGPAERCRALALVLPPDAAFGLETAAELLGAPVRRPAAVRVVVPSGCVPPRRPGVTAHARLLEPEDVVALGGLRLTSGPQTFLDLAALLTAEELLAVGDGLARAGHLTAPGLTARLGRAGGVRGVVRAREVAPLVDPAAASRPESIVRHRLLAGGLPAPELQLEVRDRFGRVLGHADLGWARYRVAVEYEGRQHAEPDQFGRDVDRYSLMAADGWLVIRFSGRHLAGRDVVVERSRRALLARGWRP